MNKRICPPRGRAEEEERLALRRVLDRARQALERDAVSATDFLTPAQQTRAEAALRAAGVPPERYCLLGGYEGAQRRIILFLPGWLPPEQAADHSPIRCLRAAFREGEGLTHRDFLGSLTALGIAREKIGDILTGQGSADVLVLRTVSGFLLQNWTGAGAAALRLREIDPGSVRVPEAQFEIRRCTVPSLRLDAVCAAGFRLARSQAAAHIAAGHVRLDGQVCLKPDRQAVPGDAVSLRGRGKLTLEAAGDPTRKGRVPITVRCWR